MKGLLVWTHLGKSRLQKLIGDDVLDRLEPIIPALLQSGDLYSKKNLVKVFDAFSGTDSLRKKEFRREFFNTLPEETINQIIRVSEPNRVSDDFERKRDFLVSSPWADNPLTHEIIKALNFPYSAIPYEKKQYENFVTIKPTDKSYKALKDYQNTVFYNSFEKLKIPRSRFIIQMPTGSGKTRTAMEIITSFFNESKEGTVVLWLAHSSELCEQAYEAFVEIWSHVSAKPLRLIPAWGNVRQIDPKFEESSFIIGGFQKLYSMIGKHKDIFDQLKSRTKLIVVDEAHKVLAPTYLEVTRAFLGRETHVIGLTATPGRSVTSLEQNKKLASFFFEGMVGIDAQGASPIEYLRNKGVLSRVRRAPLTTSRSFSLTNSQLRHLERKFDFPPGFLKTVGSDDIRNLEIIKSLEKECGDGRQIIFFGCSVEHSKFICALLTFLEIEAAHIDGGTPNSRRSAIIESFRKGDTKVICNFGVLSTGFDAPKTDVVFISRPTTSIVLYSQMVGRGLRGPAIGGTETCKLIDVIDNIEGFSNENSVYDYFEEYYQNDNN